MSPLSVVISPSTFNIQNKRIVMRNFVLTVLWYDVNEEQAPRPHRPARVLVSAVNLVILALAGTLCSTFRT